MEQPGITVYRLFRPLIDKYIQLFQEGEDEWTANLCRTFDLKSDIFFVQTLDFEDRIHFWYEKLHINRQGVTAILMCILRNRYLCRNSWKRPTALLCGMELEMLYTVKAFMQNNPTVIRCYPRFYLLLESLCAFRYVD